VARYSQERELRADDLALQGLVVGVEGRFQFAGLGQGGAAVVVVGGAVALGEAFGGRVVVAGLIQSQGLPLRVCEVLRRFSRFLCLQQALALLVASLIMVCSSPLSYSSTMMSLPPTSSPATHSCGKVGQLAYFGRLARISGFCRMSTKANFSPQPITTCAALAEKPHCGAFGEPFMYSRTVFLLIWSLIVSMISMEHLA